MSKSKTQIIREQAQAMGLELFFLPNEDNDDIEYIGHPDQLLPINEHGTEPKFIVGNYVLVSTANDPKYPFRIMGAWDNETDIQIRTDYGVLTYIPKKLCTPLTPLMAHEYFHLASFNAAKAAGRYTD